ncbi:MAG: hypothetical protein IPL88_06660 [Rhizobiales bacterium]|nr:hypothetical protein [Hyphomicrobiales bacterium]
MSRIIRVATIVVAASFLACGAAEAAKRPACKAGSAPERAICADADLAALSREVARLDALAAASRDLNADARANLVETRKAHLAERGACGAQAGCLADAMVGRIHALRQIPAARAKDAAGISAGPQAYACDGVAQTVLATTVRGKTPRMFLGWSDFDYVLAAGKAGEPYRTELDTGEMSFAPAGEGATLTIPGTPPRACRAAQ